MAYQRNPMSELRKSLIGLLAAVIALAGAIVLKTHAESEHNASLSEAAAAAPPA